MFIILSPVIRHVIHILCLYDAFIMERDRPTGVLIIELMANTLKDVPLTDEEIPSFVLDMLEGLVFLHRVGISHNDLRDDNIFRSLPSHPDEPAFKIGDFSEGKVNSTMSDKLMDDYQMAYIFLDKIYKISPEEHEQGLLHILREVLVYPRRESTIPSNALEYMIRQMFHRDVGERWSSERALGYILDFIHP